MMISFTVYGSPVAQPRTKAQGFMSKSGRIFAHVYEPGKKDSPARQWKADIKQEAVKRLPAQPHGGPIGVAIDFYFPRPQFLMKKKSLPGRIPHVKKPDRDNCEKAVLDALRGLFFVDDSQVCAGEVRKFYHEKDRGPRAEISLWQIGEEIEDRNRDDTARTATL